MHHDHLLESTSRGQGGRPSSQSKERPDRSIQSLTNGEDNTYTTDSIRVHTHGRGKTKFVSTLLPATSVVSASSTRGGIARQVVELA